MDIFQRSIHSNVKQIDGGRLLVASSLLDLEHSLHLELVVRAADRTIFSIPPADPAQTSNQPRRASRTIMR